MRKFQRVKKTFLFVSSSLVITFAYLMHVNCARAEEVEGIVPTQGFDVVYLLSGQDMTIDTSQITSSDSHSVVAVSLGNKSLAARLTISSNDVIGPWGFWWITLWGTSITRSFGFAFGFGSGGQAANVALDQWAGLGLATGGVIAASPVSAAEPIKYKINVKGTAW